MQTFGVKSRQHMSDEDGVLFSYSRKRSYIEKEEDRSRDWSLWNTERNGSLLGCVAMDADRVSAICKVG